jgi:leader peptidase (prepilin peptidase)/N-methyltransferase
VQYPIVELLSAVLTALYVMEYGISTTALASMLFTYALIVLTLIDQRHQLLPDQITLPLLWLGLLVNLSGLFASPADGIIGAALGYLSLWSVFWLFKLITGREGMGYGDFKLSAALGAWLGWQMLPMVILLASLLGLVVGCYGIIFAGRDREAPLAFGPYLCIAGWIAMLWGDSISLYLF